MSSQICQNNSTESEAAVNRLSPLPLRASYTYLSRGFYCDHEDVALEGRGHFFRELAEKKPRALSFSESCKTSEVAAFSPGRAEASQGEWAKLRAHGSRPGLGEKPDPGPLELQALGSTPDPQLCDFLENHFRGEEVKLIKKMGDT